MRKLFINKWFFLGASLTLSLSAFSLYEVGKTQSVCSMTRCRQTPADASQKSEMLWDIISRQVTNFISIQ